MYRRIKMRDRYKVLVVVLIICSRLFNDSFKATFYRLSKVCLNVSIKAGFITSYNVRFKANFNITFNLTLILIIMLD